ncbi:MAG: hypothetical protein R2932_23655 [Caldilineaceae bacterium]
MLDIYTDFAVNKAAIPVIPGEKSEGERFAGADRTFTIEAIMGDGLCPPIRNLAQLGPEFCQGL